MHPCNQGGWGEGGEKTRRKKMKPVATCTNNYVIESLWCPTKLKFIKKFLSNINNNIEIKSPYVAHIINICWLSGHHEHRKRNTTEKFGNMILKYYCLSSLCHKCDGPYHYDHNRNLTMRGWLEQETRCQTVCNLRVQGLLAQATLKA